MMQVKKEMFVGVLALAVGAWGMVPTVAPTYKACSSLAFTQRAITTSATARDVAVSDADSDGALDVFASSSTGVDWYDGDGSWTQHVVATGINGQSLSIADLDGDGDFDVLVHESVAIYWIENVDGLGTDWTVHTVKAITTSVEDLVAIDVDSDSDLDVLYVDGLLETVGWFENDGTLTGATEHLLDSAFGNTGLKAVAAADVDGETSSLVGQRTKSILFRASFS